MFDHVCFWACVFVCRIEYQQVAFFQQLPLGDDRPCGRMRSSTSTSGVRKLTWRQRDQPSVGPQGDDFCMCSALSYAISHLLRGLAGLALLSSSLSLHPTWPSHHLQQRSESHMTHVMNKSNKVNSRNPDRIKLFPCI